MGWGGGHQFPWYSNDTVQWCSDRTRRWLGGRWGGGRQVPSSQPTCTWGSTGCTLFILNGTTIDIYLLSGPQSIVYLSLCLTIHVHV